MKYELIEDCIGFSSFLEETELQKDELDKNYQAYAFFKVNEISVNLKVTRKGCIDFEVEGSHDKVPMTKIKGALIFRRLLKIWKEMLPYLEGELFCHAWNCDGNHEMRIKTYHKIGFKIVEEHNENDEDDYNEPMIKMVLV